MQSPKIEVVEELKDIERQINELFKERNKLCSQESKRLKTIYCNKRVKIKGQKGWSTGIIFDVIATVDGGIFKIGPDPKHISTYYPYSFSTITLLDNLTE